MPTSSSYWFDENGNPTTAGLETSLVNTVTDFIEPYYRPLRNGGDYNNDLDQSRYDFKSLTFPGDLGNENNGHYVIININVPVEGTAGGSASRRGAFSIGDILPNEASKVDTLRFKNFGNLPGADRQLGSLPRYTRRIAQSIALHMPSPMVYDTQNVYEDISLTALGGQIITGALRLGAAAAGGFKFSAGIPGVAGGEFDTSLLGQVASDAAQNAGNIAVTGSRLAGYPINPLIEVLFSHTVQRQFAFEFLFAPRNLKESQNLEAIIRTLRFFAAPELDERTAALTFIPPAEFDLTFYNKGQENIHIPRINTGVLEKITVDYEPLGGIYSTFSNGHPVGVRMMLGFRELEIVHKKRVLQGF